MLVAAMAGDRSLRRWSAFAKARARGLLARARDVLLRDPKPEGARDEAEQAAAKELVRSAGDLKGGMAKLAQLMAYLEGPGAAADEEARAALGTLWDRAPAVPAEAVRQVIREDLGAPPEELFDNWENQPFAAASLGQVHGAVGKNGEALAVKVQFPGIAQGLRDDLGSPDLVRRLAGSDVGKALDADAIERLRDAVLGELDYLAEGEAMERFARAFAGDPRVVIPKRYPALSSQRVLTMERIHGRSFVDFARDADEPQRSAVGLTIFRTAWGGPLVHRLLNADPNPGNYLILDGAAGRVAFLDYGCVQTLDQATVDADRSLWNALLARDQHGFGGEAFRHAIQEQGLLGRARTLDSDTYREWERYVTYPFRQTEPFEWTAGYARRIAELTAQLVQAGGLRLPAPALLLWRQRLGVGSILGALRPRADFRTALAEMLRQR
jgi:predicted unusual protein kinase regulating ubiquinone biosynthesis (AarF/ABC1/UbiB family)